MESSCRAAYSRAPIDAKVAHLRLEPSRQPVEPAPHAARATYLPRPKVARPGGMRRSSYSRRDIEVSRLAAESESVLDIDELRACGLSQPAVERRTRLGRPTGYTRASTPSGHPNISLKGSHRGDQGVQAGRRSQSPSVRRWNSRFASGVNATSSYRSRQCDPHPMLGSTSPLFSHDTGRSDHPRGQADDKRDLDRSCPCRGATYP